MSRITPKRSYAASQRSLGRGSYQLTELASATRARASTIELVRPVATDWTIMFPIPLASAGPAATCRPDASAVHWHSNSLRELDGLVTREIAGGSQLILPIWHGVTQADVMAYSPTLAGKLARSTSDTEISAIASEIAEVARSRQTTGRTVQRPNECPGHGNRQPSGMPSNKGRGQSGSGKVEG